MLFRGESDLGQRRRVIGPGSGNVHQGDYGLQKVTKATKSLANLFGNQARGGLRFLRFLLSIWVPVLRVKAKRFTEGNEGNEGFGPKHLEPRQRRFLIS